MESGLHHTYRYNLELAERIAARVSEVCAVIPANALGKRFGAVFAAVNEESTIILARPVMLRFTQEDIVKNMTQYEINALEKPRRILERRSDGHEEICSAESMDVKNGKYAGGIWDWRLAMGLSGFEQERDAAVLLYVLYYERVSTLRQLEDYFNAHGKLKAKVRAEFHKIENWHRRFLSNKEK